MLTSPISANGSTSHPATQARNLGTSPDVGPTSSTVDLTSQQASYLYLRSPCPCLNSSLTVHSHVAYDENTLTTLTCPSSSPAQPQNIFLNVNVTMLYVHKILSCIAYSTGNILTLCLAGPSVSGSVEASLAPSLTHAPLLTHAPRDLQACQTREFPYGLGGLWPWGFCSHSSYCLNIFLSTGAPSLSSTLRTPSCLSAPAQQSAPPQSSPTTQSTGGSFCVLHPLSTDISQST